MPLTSMRKEQTSMWSIANLKNRGLNAMRRNYWKSVLISVLIAVMTGGLSFAAAGNMDSSSSRSSGTFNMSPAIISGSSTYNDFTGFWRLDAFLGIFLVMIMVVIAIAIVEDVFIINPFEVGSSRFFYVNQQKNANVREMAFAYDHNYKNVITVMFFRDLYTVLWSLLLVIPGIVKYYEYRMVPYILAEQPDMPKDQALMLSSRMMHGEKWRAFLLDLSFIGWAVLSVVTLGIVGIFFYLPYKQSTNATLYEALKYLKFGPGAQQNNTQQDNNSQSDNTQQYNNFQSDNTQQSNNFQSDNSQMDNSNQNNF